MGHAMKSFRQFNELFDKKVDDWKLSFTDKYQSIYEFWFDGVDKVVVDIAQRGYPGETIVSWELVFARNGQYNITGGGKALEIFATVGDIVKDFVKKKDPEHLYFSAKEASRKKLYRIIMRKLAKALNMNFEEEDIKGLSYFSLWKK
jgi:phosphoglycolate phosphatase-like HAD superfamily hydrolase